MNQGVACLWRVTGITLHQLTTDERWILRRWSSGCVRQMALQMRMSLVASARMSLAGTAARWFPGTPS
jgi:hypothetical protein